MATKVLFTQRFPTDPAATWAMLTDPEYIALKGLRSGSIEVQPEVLEQDGRTVVISRRRMPANVPAFLKRFVGEVLTLHETQTWEQGDADGTRRGSFIIDFGGQPMAFKGSLLLRGGAAGTELVTDGSLKASVPLIGKKAESVAAEWAERYLRKEEAVAEAWVAGERA